MPQPKNWARRLKFSENVTNMPNYHCVHLWSKCPIFAFKAWLSPYPSEGPEPKWWCNTWICFAWILELGLQSYDIINQSFPTPKSFYNSYLAKLDLPKPCIAKSRETYPLTVPSLTTLDCRLDTLRILPHIPHNTESNKCTFLLFVLFSSLKIYLISTLLR